MAENDDEENTTEEKVINVPIIDLLNKEFKFKTGEKIRIIIDSDTFKYSQ